MTKLKKYYPKVIDKYYNMILEIDNSISKDIDIKTRELILIAIGVALGNENVVRFHTERALKNGVSIRQIRCIALMPLPITGQTKCDDALEIIDTVGPSIE